MATNILLNQVYNGPSLIYTAEILTVSNIDISAIPSEGSTGTIIYTLQRRTQNSGWRTALDDTGKELSFETFNDETDGINIAGMNAYAVRLKVLVKDGTGTLNIEYESILIGSNTGR